MQINNPVIVDPHAPESKKSILTFIIPVLHPQNCKDWSALKSKLTQTIQSIAAQDHDAWRAIIVANRNADLPQIPPRFEVKFVDLPPNPMFERGNNTEEAFRDAIRLDKGKRILAGLIQAGQVGHIMIVDDDDFISRRLTSFVAQHPTANGWYVRDGYIWSDGSGWVYQYADFSQFCGSSHIIRADLYDIPESIETANPETVCKLLGSHIFIREHLATQGTPLEPLPFFGAVYRVGHANAWSKGNGVAHRFFFKKKFKLRVPLFEFTKRLTRLRPLNFGLRREFFGKK